METGRRKAQREQGKRGSPSDVDEVELHLSLRPPISEDLADQAFHQEGIGTARLQRSENEVDSQLRAGRSREEEERKGNEPSLPR